MFNINNNNMFNPQKLTIMKNSITIIDLDADYNINNIKGYPILIKGSYLGDILPYETGHFNDTPKTCSYGFTYNEDEGYEEFTLNNRDQVYELIKDITTAISQALTYRYTHEYLPGKLLNAPCDDETNDISNAISLLSLLDSIGTEL